MGGWKDFPASVEETRANLYKDRIVPFAGKRAWQQVRAALAQVGMEEYQNRLIGRFLWRAAAESAPGTRPGQRAEV